MWKNAFLYDLYPVIEQNWCERLQHRKRLKVLLVLSIVFVTSDVRRKAFNFSSKKRVLKPYQDVAYVLEDMCKEILDKMEAADGVLLNILRVRVKINFP